MNKLLKIGLGLDAVARLVRPGRTISSAWRALRAKRAPVDYMDGVDDAAERFRLAAEHHGISDFDGLLSRLKKAVTLYFCIATLLVAAGIVFLPANLEKYGGVLGWIFSFSLLPVALSLLMRVAFYHWQIRNRRLASFGEWIRQPGQWVPPTSNKTISSLLLFAGAAWLLPGVALAQTVSPAAPDIAMSALQSLFGGAGTFDATGLSIALGVLTQSLMGLGSAALAFWTVIGTIHTAWSGTFLGRFHQVFAPIRICLGFGLLTPIPAGWSGIHVTEYRIATWSSQTASDIWSAYVSQILLSPTAAATTATTTAPGIPASVGGVEVATEVLKSEVCAAIDINLATAIGHFAPLAQIPDFSGSYTAETGPGGTQTWSFNGGCGGLSLPVPATASPSAMLAYSTARIAALGNLGQALWQSGLPSQIAGVVTVQDDGNVEWPTSILPTLQALGKTYDTAILSASAQFLANQNQAANATLTAASTAGGWVTAPSYDRTLSTASAQVAQMASQSPAWSAPAAQTIEYDGYFEPWRRDIDEQKAYKTAVTRLDDQLKKERGAGALTAAALSSFEQGDESPAAKLLEDFDHRLSQSIIDYSAANSADPISDLMALGAKLSTIGSVGIAANIGLSFPACNGASALSGACQALLIATSYARPIFFSAIIAGWTLEYLLPMLPWIAFYFAFASWLLQAAEIVICGPIWAFLLIRIDGQDLVDQVQRPFVISLFSWALRAPLLVLSFIVVRSLRTPCLSLLKQGFSTTYVGNQGGQFVGLIGITFGALLLSYLSYQTLLRLNAAITSIPDKIPGMLGLGGGGADADTHNSIRAIGAFVQKSTPSAPSPGGNRGGGASKIPKSGGGGAPGLRVSGGDDGGGDGGGSASKMGGGGEPHWGTATSGGLEALSDSQRAAAAEDHKKWQADTGLSYSLASYVDHAQKREAAKRRG